MKPLAKRPSRADVESIIRDFFQCLKEQQIDEAERVVEHAGTDWPYQIWSLWQDLDALALDMDPDDPAYGFEAAAWRQDLSWLEKVGIQDTFHWDDDGDHLFVNVTYDGEVTDVSADFRIERKVTGWVVVRAIIKIR